MKYFVNVACAILALVAAPSARASEVLGSGRSTVTPAAEAELKALDDTLDAFMPSRDVMEMRDSQSTMAIPAPEAELRALDDTLAAFVGNRGHADASIADARITRDPERVGAVQSAEVELKALDDTLAAFAVTGSRGEPKDRYAATGRLAKA